MRKACLVPCSHCAVVAGFPSCATRRDVDAAATAHSEMVEKAPPSCYRRAIVVLSRCGRDSPSGPDVPILPPTAPPPGVRVRACVYEERERPLTCRVGEEGRGDVGDAIAADDAHSMASPLCGAPILTAPFPPHCVWEMRSLAATSSRTGRAAEQIARQSSATAQICVRAHTPWLQGSLFVAANPCPPLPSRSAMRSRMRVRACVGNACMVARRHEERAGRADRGRHSSRGTDRVRA